MHPVTSENQSHCTKLYCNDAIWLYLFLARIKWVGIIAVFHDLCSGVYMRSCCRARSIPAHVFAAGPGLSPPTSLLQGQVYPCPRLCCRARSIPAHVFPAGPGLTPPTSLLQGQVYPRPRLCCRARSMPAHIFAAGPGLSPPTSLLQGQVYPCPRLCCRARSIPAHVFAAGPGLSPPTSLLVQFVNIDMIDRRKYSTSLGKLHQEDRQTRR